MSSYNDIETKLTINDAELPCVYSFERQKEGPEFFSVTQDLGDPGSAEQITIMSAVIHPRNNLTIDLFTPEFDWLMTSDLHDALEEDAREYLKQERRGHDEERAARLIS